MVIFEKKMKCMRPTYFQKGENKKKKEYVYFQYLHFTSNCPFLGISWESILYENYIILIKYFYFI